MNSATIPFTKMQGAGNDFILIDNRAMKMSAEEIASLAPVLCNRKFGVGADGIITLQFDDTKDADLEMVYKNPDGSDAGMCGNGARCFSAFAATLGSPKEFTFRVHDKIYRASVMDESVIVEFPLQTMVLEETVEREAILNVYTNTEHIVLTAQPHELENESSLIENGRYYRNHPKYQPKGTNVNFIAGTAKDQLCLQTFERGVENLTLACGTGAVASALAWHHLQHGTSGKFTYRVKVKGGELTVHFRYKDENQTYQNIKLEGPAEFVFEGQYYIS